MARRLRPRGNSHYDKPPLDHVSLKQRLEERGLAVPDEERLIRYLRHIGYYRLSPYTIPFQRDRKNHVFIPGTSFDDVLGLYVFDRALRLLVLDALERVEVAIRASVIDHMSTTHNDAHWYVDLTYFRNTKRHNEFLSIINRQITNKLSDLPDKDEDQLIHRSALEHYLLTYGNPEFPPSWLMSEMITIGQLSSLYRNLKLRRDRNAIARSLGLESTVLESWLKTFVRVRNICAHHGRLWNVGLGVYPAIPRSAKIQWLELESALPERSRFRLYPVLVSLQAILGTISPKSSWSRRLCDLLEGQPELVKIGMGIPEDWQTDPFWQRHLE